MYKKLVEWPNKILRTVSKEVTDFETVSEVVKNLIDTCNVELGAGLAAPQIGSDQKVCVINTKVFGQNPDPFQDDAKYLVLINPVIEDMHGEDYIWVEQCLSFPNIESKISRKEFCTVHYQNVTGESKTINVQFPLSAAIQHEVDHLYGKIYLDHINKIARALKVEEMMKKRKKAVRSAKRK